MWDSPHKKSGSYLKKYRFWTIVKLPVFSIQITPATLHFNGGVAAPPTPRKSCQTFCDFDPIPVVILMKT